MFETTSTMESAIQRHAVPGDVRCMPAATQGRWPQPGIGLPNLLGQATEGN